MGPARVVIGVLVLVFVNAVSAASIYMEVTPQTVLPGYTAYGIYWDGGGTEDWTGALLIVELTHGTVYQDPLFNSYGPPPAEFLPIFPMLEYDSYFGIFGDATAGACGGAAEGYRPCTLTPTHIEIQWWNFDSSDVGVVKIGNLTVPDDAVGTYTLIANYPSHLPGGGMLAEGFIPEPATLALFALACPALLRRENTPELLAESPSS